MLDIPALRKDTLHTVMLQQLYSLNYMWMRFEFFIRTKAPQEFGTEEYYQLYEDYGLHEAGRLAKALRFPREGIKDLIRFLEHSHWAVFENIGIAELTTNSFTMRTLDCSAQKAAKKWGMEYYDCGTGALRVRSGFFRRLNPKAKVQRILTPGEARPECTPANVSCEWLIALE